jgi:hypothetical protein
MGVEIVKAAIGHPGTSRLSGNAFKVLMSMAMQALDKPKDGRPAGLYFGGWGALQVALGYDEGGPESPGHTAVKRAVRELKDGKHISPMVTAVRGTRQSYLVHPGGLLGVSTDPQSEGERGSLSDPKRGSLSDPKRGSDSDRNGGHSATLLGHIEDGRGLTKDEQINSETQPQKARGNRRSVEGHRFEGRPGDDCVECGCAYGNRRAHPLHLLRGLA